MPRELALYVDELTDPEASYRRGFQHGAATLLRLVADKLKPSDAQQLAQWVGGELRDWRIVGHEVADALVPPPHPLWRDRIRPLRRALGRKQMLDTSRPARDCLREQSGNTPRCILGASAITWSLGSASP
jgi:hypothetical protein